MCAASGKDRPGKDTSGNAPADTAAPADGSAHAILPKPGPGPSTHPRRDELGRVVHLKAPSTPTPLAGWADPAQVATCIPDGPVPERLNGLAFEPWTQAPTRAAVWNDDPGINPRLEEPPLSSHGKKLAAGAIILEPDGRVWIVHPSNQFGGYQATFPKGRLDPGVSPQATAIREAFEESGLRIEILDHLGDFPRTTTHTRYYLARRAGGTPRSHGLGIAGGVPGAAGTTGARAEWCGGWGGGGGFEDVGFGKGGESRGEVS